MELLSVIQCICACVCFGSNNQIRSNSMWQSIEVNYQKYITKCISQTLSNISYRSIYIFRITVTILYKTMKSTFFWHICLFHDIQVYDKYEQVAYCCFRSTLKFNESVFNKADGCTLLSLLSLLSLLLLL